MFAFRTSDGQEVPKAILLKGSPDRLQELRSGYPADRHPCHPRRKEWQGDGRL